MRNVLGCASFLIVSGRVLLSDVSSPPREVRTPAADDDQGDGRDSPRRTGSVRAAAPRTKITAGRRRATAGGPPGDTAPHAGHRPPPQRAVACARGCVAMPGPPAPGYSPALQCVGPNRHRHHRRSRVPPHQHSHTRVRAHARHARAQVRPHVWLPVTCVLAPTALPRTHAGIATTGWVTVIG